eukprot:3832651-Alexandrium_andersonii.AAC.1
MVNCAVKYCWFRGSRCQRLGAGRPCAFWSSGSRGIGPKSFRASGFGREVSGLEGVMRSHVKAEAAQCFQLSLIHI